jgi:HK97 gp10 family phage protein
MGSINASLEGQRELVRELMALSGPKLRAMARKVAKTAMKPTLEAARATAPVDGGRLRASIGQLASRNRRGDALTSRVGTRRDFTYRSISGQKLVSGRGKVRDKALAKGYSQDAKTAQQYARIIEFGYDKSGRLRRKAGGAHFLDNAIKSNSSTIIGTVSSEFRRHIETTRN